jgi:hypothetical protein
MQGAILGETFECGDLAAHRYGRQLARAHGNTIDNYSAGPALSEATAETGAAQSQVIAQYI